MKKSKPPAPGKSVESVEDQEEVWTQNLVELAADLVRQQGKKSMAESWRQKDSDFQKLVRKCLLQKKDDILYEALERARHTDSKAYPLLKEHFEEASEVIVSKRENGPELEVNAFVIPVFAHTNGGLHQEQCFQDEEAFALLTQSLKDAQLESQDATVVLVSHAYHLDEIDGISYSQLNEMVREAFSSMTSKKAPATPAIDRSMRGWPENDFEPDDLAVELRFLLGFTLKSMDDPFYQVPEDDAEADRHFDARAHRFQRWAQEVAPLVKRCLVRDGSDIDINFLYQDLFYGGKDRGIAEHYILQMMTEFHHVLQMHGLMPENTQAVIGPADIGGEMVLRVNLLAAEDGALLASSEKPLDVLHDLQTEADDIYDALMTIGVKSLALALQFDADGQAVEVRPYES